MVSSRPAAAEATPLILDLQTGLTLVQENNERLLQARIDLLRGREELRVARAAGLPQVDASFTYSRNWLLPSFVFAGNAVRIGTENNLTGVVSMRQPLYAGGRIRANEDMAHRQFAMLGETKRQTTQLVAAEVEERFYDLLLAEELRTVSHLALAWARRNLSQVEARAQAGRAAELDQLRAQVQVSNMRADSIRAENNLRLATMALKDVVGLDLDQAIEVRGTFRTETALDLNDLDGLVTLGLSKRPELGQVEQEIGWYERKITADQASTRPRVELVATGQTQFQSDGVRPSRSGVAQELEHRTGSANTAFRRATHWGASGAGAAGPASNRVRPATDRKTGAATNPASLLCRRGSQRAH